jgi:hypothetical protein
MASKHLARGFKRSALTVALGLCFAAGVQAQSSVGSIFGETTSNATVQIQNLDTGATREITADAAGHFNFPQLSPGRYKVTSAGVTKDVQVRVGTGSTVSFATAAAGTQLDTVTVVGASTFNPIDVSSVESTSVFTAQQIDELPVARDVTNVALLAPGTVRGDTGFGNLASFGGSSVAENGYYINGFDVTNIRNFVSFADLPFDAISEQQVKTGGYGAEFGRSLGGVVSIVTKRGTNEWKAGASVYWSPDWGREKGKDVFSRDPRVADDPNNNRFVYRSDDESDELLYNIYGGGPIIKDKLFVFGLVQGQDSQYDVFFQNDSESRSYNDPSGMLKLDWNITDDHVVELTGIWNKDVRETDYYVNPEGASYTGQHGNLVTPGVTLENGGEVYIGKYTGYLTDNFTITAQYGYLRSANNFQSELPGADCPAIYDSRDANLTLNPIGCWTEAQFTVRDAAFGGGPDEDIRRAWRIDAEWQLASHKLRFGLDHEKFESTHAGTTYSGGEYFRYFRAGDVFGPDYAFLGDVVRRRTTFTQSGGFEVINQAAYVEDSWQATDNLMLYGGIRAETFENKNGNGATFVESDTLWAPRLGFSWNVNGDSSFKVFGNAGRYYIPVASNTSIRASGYEYSDETWYFLDGVNPDGTPIIGDVLIPTGVNGSLTAPDPRTIAANNLKPMYQDEYILGFQTQLSANWQLGMRAIHRDVKAGMDDYCGHNAFNQWANDNGFDQDTGLDGFAVDGEGIDMPGCIMINPGEDVQIALDPNNTGTLSVYTVPASYLGVPEYQRKYNAVEFFWERAKANNWYLQGSYTFSKSKGNVEGYVNSTLQQDDAGVTQDFDFAAFEEGAYGYLPNDRTHTLKLFGAYDISDEWSLSANLLVQSGRPVNCNGFIPVNQLGIGEPDRGTIALYSGSSFYCRTVNNDYPRDPSGRPLPGNRGDFGRTPWTKTFDLGLTFKPKWLDGLTLQAKVFNVLNSQTATEFNESSQSTSAQSFLDPDFLNDVNYQQPRYVRFTARYEF